MSLDNNNKMVFKKGYKMTEEHKVRIGSANAIKMKEYWKNNSPTNRQLEVLRNSSNKRKKEFGYVNSPETREKLSKIMKDKYKTGDVSQKQLDLQKDITNYGKETRFMNGHSISEEARSKMKEKRSKQIMPIKDTKIEVKIQNLLKSLRVEFYTHVYMKEIEHSYQCDILIPVQEGISQKTIIECYGTYWHNYPYSREIDISRCNELRENGWRVIVLWEKEIKPMRLESLKEILTK